MKTKYFKSSVLFAVFAMLFVACDSDRDDNPKLGPNHTAKTFVVNTSAVSSFLQRILSILLGPNPTTALIL